MEQYLEMNYRNYYKTVSEHKEIVRMFMGLQGAMYQIKPDIAILLEVTDTSSRSPNHNSFFFVEIFEVLLLVGRDQRGRNSDVL